jgi:hypothetical protein
MAAPTGLPEWTIATAKVLGWSEPGLVIVVVTMVVLVLAWLLIKFIILDLPRIMQRGYDSSSGFAAFLWGLAFLVVIILAFVLNFFVVAAGVVGFVYLASLGRDWWHKGGR